MKIFKDSYSLLMLLIYQILELFGKVRKFFYEVGMKAKSWPLVRQLGTTRVLITPQGIYVYKLPVDLDSDASSS